MSLRLGLIAVAAAVSYVGYASTWTVQQNEEGVRLRWGRPVGTLGGGLHVTLPYPIERVVRVPTTEVQVVPIVVTNSDSPFGLAELDGDAAQWLTGDTNIVELHANVLYTVADPVAYLYGFTSLDDEQTHEQLVRSASEAVLTRLLVGDSIDSVLSSGKIELSRRGLQEIQESLDELGSGLRLSALNIAEINPPERVISAFNDVSSAKADRERLFAEAEGIQGTTLPRAQARASEIVQEAHTYSNDLVSRARGEAESFRKIATEVAKNPRGSRERLWLEAIERILLFAREMVVPPGSRVYVSD